MYFIALTVSPVNVFNNNNKKNKKNKKKTSDTFLTKPSKQAY